MKPTADQMLRIIIAHHQRVSELFLAKYPGSQDFVKTNRYFWNKCREQAARELGLLK